MAAVLENMPNLREIAMFVENEDVDYDYYCSRALVEALKVLLDGRLKP
jgi:hypothetical protein